MGKRIVFAIILLWTWLAILGSGLGQEAKKPYTKQEILRLLKPTPGSRVEQGDIAGEVAQRGIAFPVDEKTLNELRKAGARSFLIEAIQQAAQNANKTPAQSQAQPQAPAVSEPPANPASPASPAIPAIPATEDRPRLQRQSSSETPSTAAADPRPAPEVDVTKLPLLEQARRHAEEYMDDLPNFIVTQIVTRSIRTSEKKDWQRQDKLEVELTYRSTSGEQFKLMKYNDKPTQLAYEQLKGATSSGEFGSMLGALFAPQSQAVFKEVRRESFRGRQTTLYDFRVKKAFSLNQITDRITGRTINTGYSGSIWIDQETGRTLRIEQSAEDIQPGFPITIAESAVEYDWITVGERRFLLPISAEVLIGSDPSKYYSRNVIELKNYQIFDTDMKILPEK